MLTLRGPARRSPFGGGGGGERRRIRGTVAAGLALILVSPFLAVVPAVAAELVPVVIDLAKVTTAPVLGGAGAGDTVTFDFTITCSSTQSDCVNLALTDSFPDPLVFDTVTPNSAFTVGPAPNGFTLNFINPLDEGGVGLVAGETVTFQAVGHVVADVDASFDGTTVTNTAFATVDNPDSSTQASDDVLIEAPLVIQSTIDKAVSPSTVTGFPGEEVDFVLGASNTSNAAVDTLEISDPADAVLPTNAYEYLEVTGISAMTFPTGADRVQVDYWDGIGWNLGTPAPTAVLPVGTIKGLRFTFSNSNPAVDIARGATAAVTINTETTADVADLVVPFSGLNIASSQVIRGTDLGAIVSDNAPFTINPAAINPGAAKVFSAHDVVGGQELTATLTGQNDGDFELVSLSITEPDPLSATLADQGLEFGDIVQGDVFWPINANAVDVTYYYDDLLGPSSSSTTTRDSLPDPEPLRTVIGFTATFTSTAGMEPGEYATIPFTVRSLPTLFDVQSTNTIRVDVATADDTAVAYASDDLLRRNVRIATSITKFFSPASMFGTAGAPMLLSLPSQIDPLPSGPLDTGGSTVGATSLVIADSDPDFWSRFNATAIVATEIPAGSTLEVLYSVDGGLTYPGGQQLLAPTDGFGSTTFPIPSILHDSINGIQFTYTPTVPGELLPPGFNVQPNIRVELRSTLRGTADPVIDPLETLDQLIDNTATTHVENTVAGIFDDAADDATVTLRPLPPGGGPGYDMLEKEWRDVPETGFAAVQARSGQQATATIFWGTAGQEYASVVVSDTPDDSTTTADDPSLATVSGTVYEAFDLVRLPAITFAMDPYLQYDAISEVQYFSSVSNQWEDFTDNGNPCSPVPCYGVFPGYELSPDERDRAIGVRFIFEEHPTRPMPTDPFAPMPGTGVAPTIDTDREIDLVFQVRDTLRSDPSVAVLGATRQQLYNTTNFGEVNNAAGIEAWDETDAVLWADTADDQIQIIDTSLNVLVDKTWIDGPLGVPPLGTEQALFPSALMTISATNASVVPVNELRLDEPTGGLSPFDYVNLVQIEKLPGSTDTTSNVVLFYEGGGNSGNIDIDNAILLPPASLDTVVGISLSQTGRVPANTTIGLQLHTQLREFNRSSGDSAEPATVDNEVTASVIDPGGTTPPPGPGPDNTVTAVATASLEIEEWDYGVTATKSIATTTTEFGTSTSTSTVGTGTANPVTSTDGVPQTAAIQYENGEANASHAVVTLTGQPNGNVRTTELVMQDDEPTFWNAYNFVSLTATPLADSRKRVQVDVLLEDGAAGFGISYDTSAGIVRNCNGDLAHPDCWVIGTPSATPTLPSLPGGAVLAEIRGLRFTYTNADGSAWERPYNPTMTAQFTVDRRDLLVSPSTDPVPSTHFDYTAPAPGESQIGVFTDYVHVAAGARTIGAPLTDPPLWTTSAGAFAEIRYQHLPARVEIKKSPHGAQSLGTDIPYKIVVTNTGGALDKPLGDLVVTDRLPVDDSVLPAEPWLVIPDDPDTGSPYDIDERVSVRVADGSNVTQPTPSFTTDLLAIDGDHQDIVFTFDDAWVLPRQWTITITVRLQFAPQLPAGTPVVNTSTVVADQPFDTCEYFIDDAVTAETPQNEVDECSSPTTVFPLASAPVTIVKGVRGVDAGPLDASGVPIEETPGDPYDDLGILKTVPASSVTCDAPNVSVDIPANAEYYRYPCVPITRPGGVEEWVSTFTNGGNIGLTDIVAIDVLPAPSDRGVIVNEARGSKWTPTLSTYPTLVNLPAGATYEVLYLTDRAVSTQRCNGADIQATLGMTPSTSPPMTTGYQPCYTNPAPVDSLANRNWLTLPPGASSALLATVVAMKFVITMSVASPLEPGDKLSIIYRSITAAAPEVAETGLDIDNQSIAYNSIAAAAAGYDTTLSEVVPNRFVTEPRKVGVALATGSIELRKTVTGAAAPYSQNSFDIGLDCVSAGVNLPPQTVSLLKNAVAATVVHGMPLYAECQVSESSGYGQNPNTSSISPSTVIAQAPQTSGLETILDPNPVFGPTRPLVELSTVLNDYPMTNLTITKTVDNGGALDGEGPGANPVTPSSLRFTINCTFDNGSSTVSSYSESGRLLDDGGSYTTPTTIPVGSDCVVVEDRDRGAQSTTYVVSVGGPGTGTTAGITVNDSGNAIDFTNTYDVADLTVDKSIVGAWATAVVGPGESPHTVGPFTVNVACTRQLNTGAVDTTYTASVVFDPNLPGGMDPHTFENIIQGSDCTITESVTGGATTVSISNVTNIAGSVSRTVTNTFAEASLAVTKDVHTDAVDINGDIVYLDAPYTVLVGCTFEGNPVYGTGFLPDPSGLMTLEFTAAELGNVTDHTETITGLPAGAACSVTESPAPAMADSVLITWTAGDGPDLNSTPDSGFGSSVVVTPLIADGQPTGNTAVVNNYYGVGHFTVTKTLHGASSVQFGTGPFVIHVECFSLGVPTYDGDVTLPLPGGELFFTINDLDVASVCSAEETNFVDTSADELVYIDAFGDTDDGADVPVSDADPSVEIQNWYYTGSVEVTKTVDGDAAGLFGAGPFEIQLSCVLDVNGTPVSVNVDTDTRILDPALPLTMTTTFTGLPNDAVCTLTETDDGSATSSSITDGTTTETDVATGFTFTVDADSATTTTVDRIQPDLDLTNTFNLATLSVRKNVSTNAVDEDGDKIYYGPFPVSVACTFQGGNVYATGYDALTPMANDLEDGVDWVLTGLPSGADCTVTEDDDLDAVGTTVTVVQASGTATTSSAVAAGLTLGAAPLTNSVTLTNYYGVGSLELSKIVDGLGRDDWGTGDFTVQVTCVLTDSSGPRTVWDERYVFTLADLGPVLIEDLATGAVCTIDEDTTGTATSTQITVDAVATPGTIATATIGDDVDPIEVVVTNTFDYTSVEVSKLRTGLGAALYGDGPFEVTLSCTFDGNVIAIPGGATRELAAPLYYDRYDELPVGADCTIDESVSFGANTVSLTDGVTVASSDLPFTTGSANTVVTVTNDYEVGSLVVTKDFDGDGSSLYGDGSPIYGWAGFEVTLECQRDVDGVLTDVDFPGDPDQVLDAGSGYTYTYTDLPLGAICQVSETRKGFATVSDVGPPVTITADLVTPVEINVVNDFQLGTLALEKFSLGLFAGRHAGEEFEIAVECWQDVDGTPTLVDPITNGDTRTIRAGEVTEFEDLPVPAECTFEETVDGGADMAIYSVSSIPIIGSTLAVPEGDTEMDLGNLFTLAHSGTDADVWIMGALLSLLCGVALVAVGRRRERVRPPLA